MLEILVMIIKILVQNLVIFYLLWAEQATSHKQEIMFIRNSSQFQCKRTWKRITGRWRVIQSIFYYGRLLLPAFHNPNRSLFSSNILILSFQNWNLVLCNHSTSLWNSVEIVCDHVYIFKLLKEWLPCFLQHDSNHKILIDCWLQDIDFLLCCVHTTLYIVETKYTYRGKWTRKNYHKKFHYKENTNEIQVAITEGFILQILCWPWFASP